MTGAAARLARLRVTPRVSAPRGYAQLCALLCGLLLCGAAQAQAAATDQRLPAAASPPNTLPAVTPAAPSSATPCPAAFPVQPPRSQGARRSAIAALQPLGDACAARADYHAWLGVLLLLDAQPQAAALMLEKALMLDPQLAGARLDYAQALAQLGELAAARQLVDEVARRPDLPAGLAALLHPVIPQWRAAGWLTHWSLALLAGAETNLNSSPGIRFLTLSLPAGPLSLELDNLPLPRGGGAVRGELSLAARHPLAGGLLQLGLDAQQRTSPAQPVSNQQLDLLHASWLHAVGPGLVGLRIDHTHIGIGGHSAYRSQGWSSHYRLPLGAATPAAPAASLPATPWSRLFQPARCAATLGMNGEARRYLGNSSQDGYARAALLGLDCQTPQWATLLRLQQGRDQPRQPARLGGDQQRRDASLLLSWQGTPHSPRLGLLMSHSRTRDERIYSPLLGNQPRLIQRRSARLSWEQPLMQPAFPLSLILQLESSRQTSNIPLFGLANDSLYLGLKWER